MAIQIVTMRMILTLQSWAVAEQIRHLTRGTSEMAGVDVGECIRQCYMALGYDLARSMSDADGEQMGLATTYVRRVLAELGESDMCPNCGRKRAGRGMYCTGVGCRPTSLDMRMMFPLECGLALDAKGEPPEAKWTDDEETRSMRMPTKCAFGDHVTSTESDS